MKKTAVNPWPWSLNFGYNQAEMLVGANRHLKRIHFRNGLMPCLRPRTRSMTA